MAVLTVRQLDEATYRRLQDQARINRRSMEAEARMILDAALRGDRRLLVREAEATRRELQDSYRGDPLAELRAERDR
jgi:plasmid stability protein